MRASETVSEASPSSTASQTGVPTQVVQQVQGTQQVGHGLHWGKEALPCLLTMNICLPVLSRYSSGHLHPPILVSNPCSAPFLPPQRLLVQASVQAKPGHVSPLQLTNIQVPQQVRLLAPASSLLWDREPLPHCLLVSVLARVPDKGLIHRLPHLLALGSGL